MKKLSLILFLIPSFLMSQDSIEVKTIKYLNEYRISKGLKPLVIDQGLCKAAEHQIKYELLSDSVTHWQYQDFPNFVEISDPDERIKHFSGLDCPFGMGEITLGGKGSLRGFNHFTKDFPKKIIESFKLSPGHNECMIHKDAHKVGIKVIKDQNLIFEGEQGIRYFCVITFGI